MSPLARLIDSEYDDLEQRAMDEIEVILSPQLWRIIKARYLEGKSVPEIAFNEHLSVRTIQRYIAKALEIVRGRFASSEAKADSD
jgi:DNA-directed RNA polymerase specialized sigma24 family protein